MLKGAQLPILEPAMPAALKALYGPVLKETKFRSFSRFPGTLLAANPYVSFCGSLICVGEAIGKGEEAS